MKFLNLPIRRPAVFGTALFFFAIPALAQECPQLVDEIVWNSPAHQVAAFADYVYIGTDGGVLVVQFSGPGEIEVVGGVGLPEAAQDMEVSAGYIYVADGESGFRVIDVTDPTSPFEAGYYAPSEGAFSEVTVFGKTAYVIDAGFGLRVIDVTDPHSPSEIGSLGVDAYSTDVAVSGDCAYVAGEGLHFIDVSTPSSPIEVGFYPEWEGISVAYGGGYVYTAGADLTVIDVRDPSAPVELWSDTMCGDFCDNEQIAVSNSLVFVSHFSGHPRGSIFDIFDATNPHAVTHSGHDVEISVYRSDLAVSGRYAYLAAGDDGVYVYDVRDCAMLRLFKDSFESGDTTAWSAVVP